MKLPTTAVEPSSNVPIQREQKWTPGAGKRFPWVGASAIVGALCGLAASVAILVTSDGQPLSRWRFQPTVYLSICYTITNLLLNVALSHGATIAWWRRAISGKAQLADLHWYWSHGTSAWSASAAGRRFNWVAVACICAAVAPVNGPLIQRASTIGLYTFERPVNLSIPASPLLSQNTGYLSGRASDVAGWTANFTPVVQQFYDRKDAIVPDTGCAAAGKCSGRLQAAGFAVNCSSFEMPFNVWYPHNESQPDFQANLSIAVTGTRVFTSNFTWLATTPGTIELQVLFKDGAEAYGTRTGKNCTLRSATVEYPITVDGNSSSITLDPNSTIFDDVFVQYKEYGPSSSDEETTALGGVWFALNTLYASSGHLRFIGGMHGYELQSSGSTAAQFMDIKDTFRRGGLAGWGASYVRYQDPLDTLLSQARELMFRTALAFGNETTVQTVLATETSAVNVYRSQYVFLALAVVATVAAVVFILITFSGYWQLGREVTMSPLETANALNAPLLKDVGSNLEIQALLTSIGKHGVTYGAVTYYVGEETTNQLEVAEYGKVREPEAGDTFS